MSASVTAIPSASGATNQRAMFDHLWRTAGLQFVGFFIITAVIYGYQPQVGASAESLSAFYAGHRLRILLAALFSGLNILNIMWFAAALRNTLVEAGQEGWGAAATAASSAFAALSILFYSITAVLAFSVANAGNAPLTSALNDFAWALTVLISFPRAMLIMSGVFGLWRAGMISSSAFTAGVGAVVLGVLGGTTWMSSGIWAPDGAVARFVMPALLLVWVLGVSRVLLTRSPAARSGW